MGFLNPCRCFIPRVCPGALRVALPVFLVLAFCVSLRLSGFVAQGTGKTSSAKADAWGQFRGNPALTGISTSPLPRSLKLLWSLDVGESIESSAAIVDGVVYVGAQSGDLLAVSLISGKEIWRYRTTQFETGESSLRSKPGIGDDQADRTTPFGIGESSPCVGHGLVYIGDLGGVLHAVNAKTGKAVWTFPTESEIKSSPVLVGDLVLIGSYDSHLYALDALKGRLRWKVVTEGYVHATPSVSEGMAYISGCDETFRAIRTQDGQELFQVPAIAYTGASPALMGDAAYFGTFSNEVVRVSRKEKKVSWRYQPEEAQLPFYSSAAVVDGRVILGGRDKKIHCLQAETGKPIWTFSTKARVDSSPVVAGSRVYVGSNDGRFYVLDLIEGKKIWEFNAGAPLSASPAIAAGRIVIGSQDGQLFCFG